MTHPEFNHSVWVAKLSHAPWAISLPPAAGKGEKINKQAWPQVNSCGQACCFEGSPDGVEGRGCGLA